jgi:hypothetical protein
VNDPKGLIEQEEKKNRESRQKHNGLTPGILINHAAREILMEDLLECGGWLYDLDKDAKVVFDISTKPNRKNSRIFHLIHYLK